MAPYPDPSAPGPGPIRVARRTGDFASRPRVEPGQRKIFPEPDETGPELQLQECAEELCCEDRCRRFRGGGREADPEHVANLPRPPGVPLNHTGMRSWDRGALTNPHRETPHDPP